MQKPKKKNGTHLKYLLWHGIDEATATTFGVWSVATVTERKMRTQTDLCNYEKHRSFRFFLFQLVPVHRLLVAHNIPSLRRAFISLWFFELVALCLHSDSTITITYSRVFLLVICLAKGNLILNLLNIWMRNKRNKLNHFVLCFRKRWKCTRQNQSQEPPIWYLQDTYSPIMPTDFWWVVFFVILQIVCTVFAVVDH